MTKSGTNARIKTKLLRSEVGFLSRARLSSQTNKEPVVDVLGTNTGKEIVLLRSDDVNLILSRIPIMKGNAAQLTARVDLRILRKLLSVLPKETIVVRSGKGYIELRNPGTYRFADLSKETMHFNVLPSAAEGVQVQAGLLKQLINHALPFAADVTTIADGVFLEADKDGLNVFAIDGLRCFTAAAPTGTKGELTCCFVPRCCALAVAHISPQDDDLVSVLRTNSDLIVECPPRIIVMAQLPSLVPPELKCLKPEWINNAIAVSLDAAVLRGQLRALTTGGSKQKCTFVASSSFCTMSAVDSDDPLQTAAIDFDATASGNITFVLSGNSILDFLRRLKGAITFYAFPDAKMPVVIVSETKARCVLTQWT